MSAHARDLAASSTWPSERAAARSPWASVIQPGSGSPTVTVVIATQPGPRLRSVERRRLAYRLRGVDRRLRLAVSAPVRRTLVNRLIHLADTAAELSVGDGLALVVSTGDSAVVHLNHPVRSRTLIGDPPSRLDIAAAAAVPERLAILMLTSDRARLMVADRGVVRDVVGDGLPAVRRRRPDVDESPSDYATRTGALVTRALPPQTPLVAAGDERLAVAYADHATDGHVVAVLAGDHRSTSPLVLLALARRKLHRSLTVPQRQALAEVAVAMTEGRLTVGTDGVHHGVTRARRPLLVIEQGLQAQDHEVRAAVAIVEARGGRVVVVPKGRLLEHGHIVLVREPTDFVSC